MLFMFQNEPELESEVDTTPVINNITSTKVTRDRTLKMSIAIHGH